MEQINKTAEQMQAFANDFAHLLAKYDFTNGYFVATNTTPDNSNGGIFANRTALLSPAIAGFWNATKEAIEKQHPILLQPIRQN